MVIDTVSRVSNGVSLIPSATVPAAVTDNVWSAINSVGATGFTVSEMFATAGTVPGFGVSGRDHEVSGGDLSGRDGQADKLRRRQRPTAPAIVSSGR